MEKTIKEMKEDFLNELSQVEDNYIEYESQLDRAVQGVHEDFKIEALKSEINKIKEELDI